MELREWKVNTVGVWIALSFLISLEMFYRSSKQVKLWRINLLTKHKLSKILYFLHNLYFQNLVKYTSVSSVECDLHMYIIYSNWCDRIIVSHMYESVHICLYMCFCTCKLARTRECFSTPYWHLLLWLYTIFSLFILISKVF